MSYSPEQIRELEDRLIELAHELDALISQSKQSAKPVTLDQSKVGRLSRMDAMQGQALAVAGLNKLVAQRSEIKQKLRMLNSTEFGFCDECDELIPFKRIFLNPLANYCVNCQSRLESG